MKFISIILITITLSSCSLAELQKHIPSFGDTKQVKGGGTGNQGIGELALSNTNGNSESYTRSNVDKKDNSNHTPIEVSQAKTIISGKSVDKSKNSSIVKNASDDIARDKNQITNHNNDITLWFWLAITGWIGSVIGWMMDTPRTMIERWRGKNE